MQVVQDLLYKQAARLLADLAMVSDKSRTHVVRATAWAKVRGFLRGGKGYKLLPLFLCWAGLKRRASIRADAADAVTSGGVRMHKITAASLGFIGASQLLLQDPPQDPMALFEETAYTTCDYPAWAMPTDTNPQRRLIVASMTFCAAGLGWDVTLSDALQQVQQDAAAAELPTAWTCPVQQQQPGPDAAKAGGVKRAAEDQLDELQPDPKSAKLPASAPEMLGWMA